MNDNVTVIVAKQDYNVLVLLLPSSILGLLARLGLIALSSYPGQSVFPLLYVQAVGCVVMGAAMELREPIGDWYLPAYTAITTGFCGSLTTFSGWQLDVFTSWINADGADRSGVRDAVDGIGKIVFTLSVSLASLSFGRNLAPGLRHRVPRFPPPSTGARYVLFCLSILMYGATIPVFLFLRSYRHQVTAALLFGPPGAIARYLLSLKLNPIRPSFPIGTFTVNIMGTVLLCAFHVLQSAPATPISPDACALLQGLSDGLCGCLTTVSTFAVEIYGLKGKPKWIYTFSSLVVAQIMILTIMGTALLSGKVGKQAVCQFTG